RFDENGGARLEDRRQRPRDPEHDRGGQNRWNAPENPAASQDVEIDAEVELLRPPGEAAVDVLNARHAKPGLSWSSPAPSQPTAPQAPFQPPPPSGRTEPCRARPPSRGWRRQGPSGRAPCTPYRDGIAPWRHPEAF